MNHASIPGTGQGPSWKNGSPNSATIGAGYLTKLCRAQLTPEFTATGTTGRRGYAVRLPTVSDEPASSRFPVYRPILILSYEKDISKS